MQTNNKNVHKISWDIQCPKTHFMSCNHLTKCVKRVVLLGKKVKTFVINMRDKTNKCFCFTVKAHICDDQGPCCFFFWLTNLWNALFLFSSALSWTNINNHKLLHQLAVIFCHFRFFSYFRTLKLLCKKLFCSNYLLIKNTVFCMLAIAVINWLNLSIIRLKVKKQSTCQLQ